MPSFSQVHGLRVSTHLKSEHFAHIVEVSGVHTPLVEVALFATLHLPAIHKPCVGNVPHPLPPFTRPPLVLFYLQEEQTNCFSQPMCTRIGLRSSITTISYNHHKNCIYHNYSNNTPYSSNTSSPGVRTRQSIGWYQGSRWPLATLQSVSPKPCVAICFAVKINIITANPSWWIPSVERTTAHAVYCGLWSHLVADDGSVHWQNGTDIILNCSLPFLHFTIASYCLVLTFWPVQYCDVIYVMVYVWKARNFSPWLR